MATEIGKHATCIRRSMQTSQVKQVDMTGTVSTETCMTNIFKHYVNVNIGPTAHNYTVRLRSPSVL